jgi:DNA-binding GntR family transcriptional regulator
VLRVLRRRDNGRHVSYEHVVLVLGRLPGWVPDSEMASDFLSRARDHGVDLGQATERIALVKASKDVAEQLGLDEGALVMRLDRIVETTGGIPVTWRIAYVDRQPAGDGRGSAP